MKVIIDGHLNLDQHLKIPMMSIKSEKSLMKVFLISLNTSSYLFMLIKSFVVTQDGRKVKVKNCMNSSELKILFLNVN